MSLTVAGPAVSGPSANPTATLSAALQEFESVLTDEQKLIYRSNYSKPCTSDVVAFVSRVDADNKGRARKCVAPRLCSFLECTVQFTTSVDTFVQSNPAIAALVWGSVRTTILAASNYASYFDKITDMIMTIGRTSPTYAQFGEIYPGNPGLQAALCDYYATVIRVCIKVIQILRRGAFASIVSPVLSPFEIEFKELLNQLSQNARHIDIQTSLASKKTIQDEARLAEIERKENKAHRRLLSKLNNDLREESSQWRIERTARQLAKKRVAIYKKLCTIDHLKRWWQLKRQHLLGTADWFRGHPDFIQWSQSPKTSVLWCSGKMGCGKSVFVSNIIACLVDERPRPTESISYFFSRLDEPTSLQPRTIVGSICRQLLESTIAVMKIDELTNFLDRIESATAQEVLDLLLEHLERGRLHYIVLDGLDECGTADITEIALLLSQLRMQEHHHFRILCAARPELEESLFKLHRPDYHLDLSGQKVHTDIETYIESTLGSCLDGGDLLLGEPSLILKIRAALQAGAGDMFLWARLSIEEICLCNNDAEIEAALDNLPRELSQIYDRKMGRVCDRQTNPSSAFKLLEICCAAKRPLTLNEMREALTVEAGQTFLHESRLSNNMGYTVSTCHGLIYTDEQDNTIHFIHPSVKQYLSGPRAPEMRQLDDEDTLNSRMGVLCLTYLDFGDFERQVSKRSIVVGKVDPLEISYVATNLNRQTTAKIAQRLLRWKGAQKVTETGTGDVRSQALQNLIDLSKRCDGQDEAYHLLGYARNHWFDHFQDARSLNDPDAKQLFIKHIDKHDFSVAAVSSRVYSETHSLPNQSSLCRYALAHDHGSLMRHDLSFIRLKLKASYALAQPDHFSTIVTRLLVHASSTRKFYARAALLGYITTEPRFEITQSMNHERFVRYILSMTFSQSSAIPLSSNAVYIRRTIFFQQAIDDAVASGSKSTLQALLDCFSTVDVDMDIEAWFLACLNWEDFEMAKEVIRRFRTVTNGATTARFIHQKNSNFVQGNSCITELALALLINRHTTRTDNIKLLSQIRLSWILWAIYIGNEGLVRFMLDYGEELDCDFIRPRQTMYIDPFYIALATRNLELFDFFLRQAKTSPDNKIQVPKIPSSSVLSLFADEADEMLAIKKWHAYSNEAYFTLAVSNGLTETIRWLIDSEAAVSPGSKYGILMRAIKKKDLDIVTMLVTVGHWLDYYGLSDDYNQSPMEQFHANMLRQDPGLCRLKRASNTPFAGRLTSDQVTFQCSQDSDAGIGDRIWQLVIKTIASTVSEANWETLMHSVDEWYAPEEPFYGID